MPCAHHSLPCLTSKSVISPRNLISLTTEQYQESRALGGHAACLSRLSISLSVQSASPTWWGPLFAINIIIDLDLSDYKKGLGQA